VTKTKTANSFSKCILSVAFLASTADLCAADPQQKDASATRNPAPAVSLFDGKTLENWRVLAINDFEDHGKVTVADGEIVLEKGKPATGISYQGDFPRQDYEVSLEAKRVEGSDFFCGMTFPVEAQYCTLILGGWGGGVTGLSNIDDESAVENETTGYVNFEKDRWYRVKLRVCNRYVEVWIDDKKVIDVDGQDRKFSIWWEQEPVRPFGIATWYTTGAVRNIQLQRLSASSPEP
jgi:hypothetical protein